MRHMSFVPMQAEYPVCLLVPEIRKSEIKEAYIDPYGLGEADVLTLDLFKKPGKGKTPVGEIRKYLDEEVKPILEQFKVQYLIVTDGDYFKAITKAAKTEANLGYVMDTDWGPWKIIYAPNYRTIFLDPPKVKAKIKQAMSALVAHAQGTYTPPGNDVIQVAHYPRSNADIADWFQKLLDMDCDLSSDIEAFSLKHHDAGIGTITFNWSKTEGVAFPVDIEETQGPWTKQGMHPLHHKGFNTEVRAMLKSFFIELYKRGRKLIWHNISYDVYVLIYQLFMEDLLDTSGLLIGMEILLSDWDDTKLITYLATNSCAGNKLGLKDQAQAYAGNYAVEEIKDIRRIPMDKLLEYNLVDGLSTWYVYDKHWPTVVKDKQVTFYNDIFKPAILDIIQMQLTGLPIDMEQTRKIAVQLNQDQDNAIRSIQMNPIVKEFVYTLEEEHVRKRNETLKKKVIVIGDEPQSFNPNSDQQLQKLLFGTLKLPILGLTDNGEPETGKDTLKALKNHTTDVDTLQLLDDLIDFKAVNKIITSFLPPMLNSVMGPDGWHYLFGNFNLGGTISGRLSSSNPNLQNIPATGSKYAKAIKSCFRAPPGWLFCGLDFNSLEDRISALTTKDPNKIKVYTDGYDGHSLRAYAYFGDQMPDIDPSSVASINSIQTKYKSLRQLSKAPTFALTYQGTWKTLIANCGFTEVIARSIEARYHELYVVSDKWVADKLQQATKDGYVEVAFGMRLRTPLLHQVILGSSKTPYAASAEGRTAGNALGQSWCLLNSRAGSEFMAIVRSSEHRLNIKPCAHIHDAQYYLIKDDIGVISFANLHLVNAVKWQHHAEIWHPDVPLGGDLSIFHPTWNDEITIPNDTFDDDIFSVIDEAMREREEKALKAAVELAKKEMAS